MNRISAYQQPLFDEAAFSEEAVEASKRSRSFGEAYRELREKYGVRRSEISRLTGISDSGISRIETQVRSPNNSTTVLLIASLAKLSGKDPYEIASILLTKEAYSAFSSLYENMRSIFVREEKQVEEPSSSGSQTSGVVLLLG